MTLAFIVVTSNKNKKSVNRDQRKQLFCFDKTTSRIMMTETSKIVSLQNRKNAD